jgi:hypothetical protein
MKPTEQEIQERARQIGDRPYHPVVLPQDRYAEQKFTGGVFIINPDKNQVFAYTGITIRFELMRTAMGTASASSPYGYFEHKAKKASEYTNAMLIQMARQELGVGDE